MYEIYTVVSEIHDNVDLVLGIKIYFGIKRRNMHEKSNI